VGDFPGGVDGVVFFEGLGWLGGVLLAVVYEGFWAW
jgi:hypothetical protein